MDDKVSSKQQELTTKTLLKHKHHRPREDKNPTKRKRVY